MDKELRFFRGVINAFTWFIVGMTFMSRMYCINLGITSGPMYIGWSTVAVVLGGMTGIHLLMWLDPSFKERG
jgi:hypothetical protein